MIPGFERIVEERIKRAVREGDLDNLPGTGAPLILEDDAHIPQELRLAYKILKNADCLPPEIELKKEILQTEDLLTTIDDAAEKYHVMKKLNFLIMKLNTMRNISITSEMPQVYLEKIADRLTPGRT